MRAAGSVARASAGQSAVSMIGCRRYGPYDQGAAFVHGLSPDGLLPETIEYPNHPWFIGVQYHTELKSRPFDPHPLFRSFIAAALEQSRLV